MKRSLLAQSLFAVACVTIALGTDGCLADKRTLQIGDGDGDAGSTPRRDSSAPDEDGGVEPGETLPCDPVKQSGCLDTRKCTLDSKGKAVCANAGTKTTGAACTAPFPDSCARGNICGGIAANVAFCRQFCTKNADCTQPSPSGQPTNEPLCAFDYGDTPFRVCSVACNPVPAAGKSGCIGGIGCVYGNLGGVLVTDCNRTAGAGTNDAPCSKNEDCADGYLCASTKCRAYCRNGVNTDCVNGGYTCEAAIGATAQFGVCCPPSPTPC